MEQRADDELVLDIDEKLGNLSSIPPIPLEHSIFRVHDALRNINVKAYEPQVIAIGPYHHAKDEKKAHLRPMEEHKLRYLKQLLERRNETSARRYIVALQQSEEKARKFYAERISLCSNKFVEMMLLDGCFIIEFLRKNMEYFLRLNSDQEMDNDPIFQLSHIRHALKRDLQLFENQLPLFILVRLLNMTKEGSENIIEMAVMNFNFENSTIGFQNIKELPPFLSQVQRGIENIEEIPHLLSLVHKCCCYPFEESLSQTSLSQTDNNINDGGQEVKNGMFIESATKLREAGVKFDTAVVNRSWSLFDITFKKGTMTIPTLVVDDDTDCLFRNYMAYEQYLPYDYPKYFTNYMHFIDCLLTSPKDVEILRHNGIIENLLGDDEVVSSMVNKLGDNIIMDFDSSFKKCYSKRFLEVNNYCGYPINKWFAKLRRDYFYTPWAFISVVAAFVLFVLTVTQTVFSILSFVLSIQFT